MKIGLYQHGSTPAEGVAEALAEFDLKVAFRNALYFNGNELEKFETVVVDDGKNSDAILAAYKAAGIEVIPLEDIIDGEAALAATAASTGAVDVPLVDPAEAKAPPSSKAPPVSKAKFDPDKKPAAKKPPKKQG